MPTPIFGIITDPGVGGTFLTWTVHYLSGHSDYFCYKKNKIIDLPNNPCTSINAHNFVANHPESLSEYYLVVNSLPPSDKFHCIYFHNLFQPDLNAQTQSVSSDNIEAIDHLHGVSKKTIHLCLHHSHRLYYVSYSSRDLRSKFLDPNVFCADFDDQHRDFIDTFFSGKSEHFNNFKNRWDYREFLALNLNPDNYPSIAPNIRPIHSPYLIESFDLFLNLRYKELFEYLEVKIDPTRIDQWKTVYRNWQNIHTNHISFTLQFDQIIDAIINNYNLDLTQFNLDIVQEAAIERALLFQHNLALKIHGLDKFTNTKELFNRLEPNTYHQINS